MPGICIPALADRTLYRKSFRCLASLQARPIANTWRDQAEYRQPHRHRRAFTQLALHFDFAALQINTALYDHQAETRTWTVSDVMPAVEGVEEPFLVGFWNSDALIAESRAISAPIAKVRA